MKQPIVLIAASGLAREVAAAVEAAGSHQIVGVLDDKPGLHGSTFGGATVSGNVDSAVDLQHVQFVICAGQGDARRRIVDRPAAGGIRSGQYAKVVHPSAMVSSTCIIGPGSVLLAHVSMTANVTVGDHVVVMPQAVMTHDVVIADYATLCAGVVLGGNVHVESGAYLGMNSSVRQGLRVGRQATLGMGSVLLDDLPAEQTWVGVPAKSVTARSAVRVAQLHDIRVKSAYTVTEGYDA